VGKLLLDVAVAAGVGLVAFAAVVAIYAGEPFNVASIAGLGGAALVFWATGPATIERAR
jgi:hypothetical protein